MSNSIIKHTPGPWHYSGGRIYDEQSFSVGEPDSVYGILENWEQAGYSHWSDAPSITRIDRTDEEAEANGLLMAAAPDLYAACKEFIRKVECGEAQSTRSYLQMKAAVDKADGVSKQIIQSRT
jgi:hypothetical protein